MEFVAPKRSPPRLSLELFLSDRKTGEHLGNKFSQVSVRHITFWAVKKKTLMKLNCLMLRPRDILIQNIEGIPRMCI